MRGFQDCRRARLCEIATGSGGFDTHLFKGIQRVDQSGAAPIENVIVSQHTAVMPAVVRQPAFSGLIR